MPWKLYTREVNTGSWEPLVFSSLFWLAFAEKIKITNNLPWVDNRKFLSILTSCFKISECLWVCPFIHLSVPGFLSTQHDILLPVELYRLPKAYGLNKDLFLPERSFLPRYRVMRYQRLVYLHLHDILWRACCHD